MLLPSEKEVLSYKKAIARKARSIDKLMDSHLQAQENIIEAMLLAAVYETMNYMLKNTIQVATQNLAIVYDCSESDMEEGVNDLLIEIEKQLPEGFTVTYAIVEVVKVHKVFIVELILKYQE